MRSGLTEPLVTTAGDGRHREGRPRAARLLRGPGRLDDHRQDLPLRHLARRELPHEHLRRRPEHQARDRRRDAWTRSANTSQRAPLWFSTVIADPSAAPAGYTGTSGGNGSGTARNTSAQIFYLYDEPCDSEDCDGSSTTPERQPQHPQHRSDRAPRSSSYSTCQNTDAMKQPGLMGTDPPPGSSSTPLYKYSADLGGRLPRRPRDDAQGQQLPHQLLGRRTPTNTAVPNKWAVHAWATQRASTQRLPPQRPRDGVDLHADRRRRFRAGFLCATLIERTVSGGVPPTRRSGRPPMTSSNWPTTPRRLSFTFTVSPAGRHRRRPPARAGPARARRVGARTSRSALRPPELPVAARGRDHDPARRLTR